MDVSSQPVDLLRRRNFRKVVRAAVQSRHYWAASRALILCSRPDEFLLRYVTGRGVYPCRSVLNTPIGRVSLTLHNWHDARTIHEIFLAEDYRIDRHAEIIVDYGSNIGLSAAYFLSRNATSYAYLFEPVPQNVERLRDNLRPFAGRFQLNEAAVGVRDGSVSFGIEETGRYGGVNLQTGQYLQVECRDSNRILQDIIDRHGRVDVLKIDVETLERAIVFHLTTELAAKIRLLFVECHFSTNPLRSTHTMTSYGTVSRLDAIRQQRV
jgi:FkbM family methyltransferase